MKFDDVVPNDVTKRESINSEEDRTKDRPLGDTTMQRPMVRDVPRDLYTLFPILHIRFKPAKYGVSYSQDMF